MMSRKISTLTLFSYLFFLTLNIIYFQLFTIYHVEVHNNSNFFTYFYFPYNSDHDKSYVHHFGRLIEGYDIGTFSIQNGIAYFYYFLSLIFMFDKTHIELTTFIVNNIFIIIGFSYFSLIKSKILKLGSSGNYLFFLNPLLIWHSQLINKEIIMMTLILMMGYYLCLKKDSIVVLITGFIFLIRYYLGLIGLALIAGLKFKNKLLILFLAYLFIMFLTAYYYSQSDRTIFLINRMYPGEEFDKGITGVASLTVHLNFNYFYIGNFLMGPIKALAYLYDLIRCYYFFAGSRIDLHLLFHIPIVTFFLINIKSIISFLYNIDYLSKTILWPLFMILIITFFIFLGSPLIHARYLFPLFYILVLIILKWNSMMREINEKK